MDRPRWTDAELAARIAGEAGRLLKSIRASGCLEGAALGSAGDAAAHQFLCHALRHHRPEDGLLSEEGRDDDARLSQFRVWIVDPVDGTREYGEGRTDWAVHVGLAIDGDPAIGAVALPDLDLVLRSDVPASPRPAPERPRLVVSRTRPASQSVALAKALNGTLIEMGSAGAKAMAVVRGEADVYLHSGGQHQWDNCAPAAVALAHGLHASRIDGSPLRYNEPSTLVPDLLICRAELADPVLALLAKAQ